MKNKVCALVAEKKIYLLLLLVCSTMMMFADAKKEFSLTAHTGFGFDTASARHAELDFEQVRGDFDTNPFVTETLAHIERKSALGDRIIAMLEAVK